MVAPLSTIPSYFSKTSSTAPDAQAAFEQFPLRGVTAMPAHGPSSAVARAAGTCPPRPYYLSIGVTTAAWPLVSGRLARTGRFENWAQKHLCSGNAGLMTARRRRRRADINRNVSGCRIRDRIWLLPCPWGSKHVWCTVWNAAPPKKMQTAISAPFRVQVVTAVCICVAD